MYNDIENQNDIDTINSLKGYDCEILYQINKGYGDALIQGINNVKTKYFCIFNADGSFDPKELDLMIKRLLVMRMILIQHYIWLKRFI